MSSSHGNFVWYELTASDAKAAEVFYRNVIGWSTQDAGAPGMNYTILSVGDTKVAGLMAMCQEGTDAGAKTGWAGYILVDDVDEYSERAKKAGGAVRYGPAEIPGGIGRYAIVTDPFGAAFVLFKPVMTGDAPKRPAPGTPGTIGWHELHAGDGPRAFDFYSGLFGWTKVDTLDMGPMGIYQTFATASSGKHVGGMMTKTPDLPAPKWFYYFNVDGIDAAAGRVRDNGGQVLMGPHEVPGGQWIIQCLDPQGTMFAAVSMRR